MLVCGSLRCFYYFYFFFFKQKTAYEMRISDWSSDVCSSDLLVLFTDVRQRLDSGAARALAGAFADPSIGAASGELILEGATGFGQGIDAYWRYEKLIRR